MGESENANPEDGMVESGKRDVMRLYGRCRMRESVVDEEVISEVSHAANSDAMLVLEMMRAESVAAMEMAWTEVMRRDFGDEMRLDRWICISR